MTSKAPTPYAGLNGVLEEMVTRVRGALGGTFVGAYLQHQDFEERVLARRLVKRYRSALEDADVVLNPYYVRYGDFYVQGCYSHGLELLSRPDRPTAIASTMHFDIV